MMDLIDRLKQIGERIAQSKEQVETEEATKTAFVLPFISLLGFDVFNPNEVIPEYTADIGIKKGEKVDYCIQRDGQPIIIIECKHWKQQLDFGKNSQIHRYFHATNSRFAILTNGISYQFYTDLDAPNKMDAKPFLEFSILAVNEAIAQELKKFHKDNFDVEQIVSTASELKHSKQIKDILSVEFKNPSLEFIRFLVAQIYDGRITGKVLEQFGGLVQKSVRNLINEMVNERIQLALNKEEVKEDTKEVEAVTEEKVVTTEIELEGFRIVQAILRRTIDIKRINYRDGQSYFGVLLDNNNRKPICRLWFNRSQKYLGLFSGDRNETRMPIDTLEDIYQHEDQLMETALGYLGGGENSGFEEKL